MVYKPRRDLMCFYSVSTVYCVFVERGKIAIMMHQKKRIKKMQKIMMEFPRTLFIYSIYIYCDFGMINLYSSNSYT